MNDDQANFQNETHILSANIPVLSIVKLYAHRNSSHFNFLITLVSHQKIFLKKSNTGKSRRRQGPSLVAYGGRDTWEVEKWRYNTVGTR